ncbi:MAG: thioredoxin domain-containing protein, partial [Deltaproteobacteria bacterium]|nr:thioredoxin domain-containing protein [Deltaproteobacteria bacterium]
TDTQDKGTVTATACHSKAPVIAGCLVAGIILGVAATLVIKGGTGGSDPVVAKYGGKSVKASEAFQAVKTRIFDLEEELYRTKEQAVNEFVEQRLLDAEAKKQNMPVNQLLAKETGGDVGEVTDKEIEEFLVSKGLKLDDPRIRKDDVRDYLKYRRNFEKRQGYVAKLKANANVKMLIAPPEAPKLVVTGDGPSWGNPKAKATIHVFSDFMCPFCARVVATIDKIKKEYGPDKVRVVFRDMPLPSHPKAFPASLAGRCANEQGKFWEYHDTLFQNQSKLDDGDLKGYAQKLGLDTAKFNECFDKKKYQEAVDKSKKEAETLGIQATPSFVINGTLLQGAQPFERFKEKIDRALN